MNRLDKEQYAVLEGEFYSDKAFKIHPLAEELPMMKSHEVTALGQNMVRFGQHDTIDLYEGMILDGRNRYYACKEFDITPRYRYLPQGTEPAQYVESKNYNRRHLTSAQKADYALNRSDDVLKKAKERKLSALKQFKNHKVTDVTSEVTTVENGRMIDILAKRYNISKNTIITAMKVRKLNDPEINKKWKDARSGEATIKSVAKLIIKKFPSKKKIENRKPELEPLKLTANPDMIQELKDRLERPVGNIRKEIINDLKKDTYSRSKNPPKKQIPSTEDEEPAPFKESEMREEIILEFNTAGEKFSKKQQLKKPIKEPAKNAKANSFATKKDSSIMYRLSKSLSSCNSLYAGY